MPQGDETGTTTSDFCGHGATMQPKAREILGLDPVSQEPARSALASLTGAQPQGAELLRNPSAALPLREGLLESDARIAVILGYADRLVPTLEEFGFSEEEIRTVVLEYADRLVPTADLVPMSPDNRTVSMERKLAAILSADVKGYSRLMDEDEEATVRTLTAYREIMAALIQRHRGRVVDFSGDNLLAEFASTVDAVRCAVEIQRELKARNAPLPDSRRMEFRMGINVGDVLVEGERLYGEGVNLAARLEGLAEAGSIFISGTVHDQVENKLFLEYDYLGEQAVKNIARLVRVYRVWGEYGAAAAPEESKEKSPGQAKKARPRSWRRACQGITATLFRK